MAIICKFCNSSEYDVAKYGNMKQVAGFWFHHFCVLFSADIEQRGVDGQGVYGFLYEDIIEELERAVNIRCSFCKKMGAAMKCSARKCKVKFHLPCGLENGCMSQFAKRFPSFCSRHRPKQRIALSIKKGIRLNPPMCTICMSGVNTRDKRNSLWAPCCRSAWFHRSCLLTQALSAASAFKCPTCNNVGKFRAAMIRLGIYIPDRVPSWLVDPSIVEPVSVFCNAEPCWAPWGRTWEMPNDGWWRFIRCRTCSSMRGTHVVCSGLQWRNVNLHDWECPECVNDAARLWPISLGNRA